LAIKQIFDDISPLHDTLSKELKWNRNESDDELAKIYSKLSSHLAIYMYRNSETLGQSLSQLLGEGFFDIFIQDLKIDYNLRLTGHSLKIVKLNALVRGL
jgi:hypothetical protein